MLTFPKIHMQAFGLTFPRLDSQAPGVHACLPLLSEDQPTGKEELLPHRDQVSLLWGLVPSSTQIHGIKWVPIHFY